MNIEFRRDVEADILAIREDEKRRMTRTNLHGKRMDIPVRDGQISILYYPNGKEGKQPFLFEIHGGGFMINLACDDDDLCHTLREKTDCSVVSIDYRRTPEFQYPIGLQDAYDAVKYVVSNEAFQVDTERIAIMGHSSGANFATVVSRMAKESGEIPIKLQILDYPYLDVYKKAGEKARIVEAVDDRMADMFAEFYTDDRELEKSPYISPVYATAEELHGMPKTYLFICGRDNLKHEACTYQKLLEEAGVSVTSYWEEKGVHGYIEQGFNYDNISAEKQSDYDIEQQNLAREQINRVAVWIKENI